MQKLFATLLVLSLATTACQSEVAKDPDAHIGCQEGEINEDGECVIADSESNNTALFDMDFEGKVSLTDVNNDEFQGVLARPTEDGDYPGIVMIHEWWGLNENIEYMAQLLANEGYTVFAIDLYDGAVAEDSSQAGELASSVRNNPDDANAKMVAAAEWLETEYNAPSLASLGWCFGGQQSLNLSLADELDATVIYYGNLLETPEELASISGPVLGIFGEEDPVVPVDSVYAFETSLHDLDVDHEVTVYPGVGHAFANPSNDGYAEEETLDAWAKTLEFLEEAL